MSFNPDQPRDERGRFASDGGGSSVGKSPGSGPRPVTRGPVQKLASGHTELMQHITEKARHYFAKERAPRTPLANRIAKGMPRYKVVNGKRKLRTVAERIKSMMK